jgi:hypothetical protein
MLLMIVHEKLFDVKGKLERHGMFVILTNEKLTNTSSYYR